MNKGQSPAYNPIWLFEQSNPRRRRCSYAIGDAQPLDVCHLMHGSGNVGRVMFDLRQ